MDIKTLMEQRRRVFNPSQQYVKLKYENKSYIGKYIEAQTLIQEFWRHDIFISCYRHLEPEILSEQFLVGSFYIQLTLGQERGKPFSLEQLNEAKALFDHFKHLRNELCSTLYYNGDNGFDLVSENLEGGYDLPERFEERAKQYKNMLNLQTIDMTIYHKEHFLRSPGSLGYYHRKVDIRNYLSSLCNDSPTYNTAKYRILIDNKFTKKKRG